MRAAVVDAFDRPPRYGVVERRAAQPGEVVVNMLAVALSPRVRTGAAGRHYTSVDALPMVPGIDGVGRTPDGRLVYVLALDSPDGTMAEQVIVDAGHLVALPEGADPITCAAAGIAGVSSWIALTARVGLRPGQEVLVLGATGVAGRLAVQIARLLGAGRVVAAGRDPDRLAGLTGVGADAVVGLGDPDAYPTALAAAAGSADIVLDYLWGTVTQRALPALLADRTPADGPMHWVSIGSTAGPEISLPSAALRSRDLHLLGSGQGSFTTADLGTPLHDLMAAVAAGTLDVPTRAVPLSDVEQVWQAPEEPGRRTVFTLPEPPRRA